MIGVIVVTHGQLANELVNATTAIVGDLPQFVAVSIGWHDNPTGARDAIKEAIDRVQGPSGVLILTDMYGATPGNVAGALLADGRVEGVAGLSLPMLVRVLSARNGDLAAAVQRALSAGAEGVLHMNEDCCRDAKR